MAGGVTTLIILALVVALYALTKIPVLAMYERGK